MDQKFDYDYIIIGSGFGGSVAALRLSEKGYRVLVLEKGKWLKEADFPMSNWNVIDGTPMKSFSRGWWAALKVAGISGFHFHDLRHTFCSNLLMAGGDLKDAKEMVGHSDIAMTDRYSHLSGLHKRNLQKQLAEYYKTGLGK